MRLVFYIVSFSSSDGRAAHRLSFIILLGVPGVQDT